MLTKEEREETAERLRKLKYIDSDGLYKSIVGKDMPQDTPASEDDRVILDHLIDLCDTSNMVELPLDKDGEVIHIGDVVYDDFGMEREVSEFRFPFDGACIYARTGGNYSTYRPKDLTHKKSVTIALLAREIQYILNDYEYSMKNLTYSKLSNIADQLESLGDSDD